MKKISGSWDAGRVLHALGRIGYSPTSAILDIMDNSVSFNGSNIEIIISVENKKSESGKGRSRSVISCIEIIDDGIGMDETGLDNAIKLGSSEKNYSNSTLSKYGMGLKSAAMSLGSKLEIISKTKISEPKKAVLDLNSIKKSGGEYFYHIDAIDKKSTKISKLPSPHGTIVSISDIHHESMPSVAEIIDELKHKIGVVYHYYLNGAQNIKKVNISVNGEKIKAIDPLFSDEIDKKDGDLDEQTWDGLSVKWITRERDIQLSNDGSIVGKVVITQLPHPPSVALSKVMGQKECRDKFMIGANNYGFYIYRNFRLISWADPLEMIGRDQNLWSFRGRLLITSDADDLLNLDVTKSRIILSEIAKSQLLPEVQEAKKKSSNAWNKRASIISELQAQGAHGIVNAEIDKVEKISINNDLIDVDSAPEKERSIIDKKRSETVKAKPASKSEVDKLRSDGERVQYVEMLENNQLWERAHDPSSGLIVKVNAAHRFIREVINGNSDNAALIKVLDILFYTLARSEFNMIYKSEHDRILSEKIMQEYRERVGGDLSETIRTIDLNSLFNAG